MPTRLTRRTLLLQTAPSLLGGALCGHVAAAGKLLDEQSPEAKALGYKGDASKVDAKTWPKWRPGRTCANCLLYVGLPADTQGGCTLFYGVEVKAAGWCDLWEPKP